MRHVFVETNWVVGFAAPEHRQMPAARELLERSQRGELKLYLPSLCLMEARRTLATKYQPRGEADALRSFVRWASGNGKLGDEERDVVFKTIDMFETKVRRELGEVDDIFARLRGEHGLEIYPLTERHLALSIELSFTLELQPFDQSVLAAVLGRADELRTTNPEDEVVFCELDSDLQPWDRDGNPRPTLRDLYDRRRMWVYSDFSMTSPPADKASES